MTNSALRRTLAALIPIVLLAGCADPPPARPARQPARGTITYNGKPPKGAVVMCWPLPLEKVDWRTVKPAGRVEADGTFRINTYELDDGAPAGEYAVTVVWAGENEDVPKPDLFRGRFSDPKKPVLKVTIREGENEWSPIKLTGPAINPDAPGAPGG